ncbi:MAG: YwqG family protein [Cyanobacteria bacterium P01_D01_bin.1]
MVEDAIEDKGSRFGGHPYLPLDFQWPTRDVGEYRFLGQINFTQIVDRPTCLPDSGLLSIFYAFDEDGAVFWGDDGYVLGFYWADCDDHSVAVSPTDAVHNSIAIKLVGGIDIPRHEDLRSDWPFDSNALDELVDVLEDSNEYLLGYPSFTSLAYDPTPKGDWISLLTVRSLSELDWCWHDDDKLMVFIETDKLVKRDFSLLKSDAG